MAAEFDKYRQNYREKVEESFPMTLKGHDFYTQAKANHLLSIIDEEMSQPASEMHILDVGCGVGSTDACLVGMVGKLHGVDMSEESLRVAKKNNPSVDYRQTNGSDIPYNDSTFELAFAINVMHHVPPLEWPDFIEEMMRVIKPGGLVVVFEHNPFNPLTRLVVNQCEFDEDAVLLKKRTTFELMQDAGLKIIRGDYILFIPSEAKWVKVIEHKLRWLPLGAQYCAVARKNQ